MRYEKLAELGIDFSSSFAPILMMLNTETGFNKNPCYYRGILMTDMVDKGDVLGSFLDVQGYRPNKIIFFDDVVENVLSVKAAAKRREIPCLGFVYRAAKKCS